MAQGFARSEQCLAVLPTGHDAMADRPSRFGRKSSCPRNSWSYASRLYFRQVGLCEYDTGDVAPNRHKPRVHELPHWRTKKQWGVRLVAASQILVWSCPRTTILIAVDHVPSELVARGVAIVMKMKRSALCKGRAFSASPRPGHNFKFHAKFSIGLGHQRAGGTDGC